MLNFFKTILVILMIVFIVVGFSFLNTGFDKKDNYYKYTNSYVGGNAYNFIINSNYFTGYMVLAGFMWLLAGLSGIGLIVLCKYNTENHNGNNIVTEITNQTKDECNDVCDVCHKKSKVKVCCSTMGAISYAYCEDCWKNGLEPYGAMVQYIGAVGKFPEDISDEYIKIVRNILNKLNTSEEKFILDINKYRNNLYV